MIKSIRKNIIRAMLKKEIAQIKRDKKMRGILFAAPVIMVLIFGYAVNTDVTEVKTVILDRDKSLASRTFVESFTASGYFHVTEYAANEKEADTYIQQSKAELCITISPGFAKNIDRGTETSPVQLIVDGSDPNRALIIQSNARRITMEFASAILQKNISRTGMRVTSTPVTIEPTVFFNPNMESRIFFLPAILALITGLVIIMLTSMSIVKERESGTIEQLTVSPIRPVEFIIGKALPFGVVALIDIIVIALFIIFWFNIPFRGSFILLIITGISYIIALLGVGIYISTISSTQQQAMLSSFLFFLPAILLSGFIFPITSMPQSIQLITYLNPIRFFMSILRSIFLKGSSPIYITADFAALLSLGILFIFLSVRRFKRGFE